ncbi:hypothetical protein [Aureimonas jatrophae]|jgi:hypothetical protein|uniref:Uncharacterized protein n=1 Tax=Aureimonas jatrophae TaxID=1166073 RepID=A0A1H0EKG3_9HYPH|nr:hypothetical protein [Aureimonas jatrophae]MBB3950454.1 hypothetical protein [Aureimonas jatrophae]SDN82851.1 hypothetical protein SAMN05192530_10282 [Aureimonas jatrophae]
MSDLRDTRVPLDEEIVSDPALHDRTVLAYDSEVGDDDDPPGIAQPLTQAEIDDVLNDPAMTIEEKQATLQRYADQIGTRDDIDRGGDFHPLETQIAEALAMLAEGGHAYGDAESVGMDPDSRSDARSPDEIERDAL